MKKRRVLICGASGFIGRNFFEALSQRDDLDVYGTFATDRGDLTLSPRLIAADLTRQEDVTRLLREKYDVLIMAAAITSGVKDIVSRPEIHVTDNAVMNSWVLRSAFDYCVPHVVFLSCAVVYQMNTGRILKEEDLDLNQGPYEKYFGGAWMKIFSEKQCEFFARLGRNKFTVVRHSNIYGPYDKFGSEGAHVTATVITRALETPEGRVFTLGGDGSEERDLLYVADLTRFLEMAIDKQSSAYEIFNVGLGETISVRALADKIIGLSGRMVRIHFDPAGPTIPTKLKLDISKAGEKLGWSPQISLDEGLQKTIQWYRDHILKRRKR
ncbi:MAG: NAD(P)-dependent oxidoreductase [Candidatus Sungiibacteriota bacterium]|uniref:NAD(P)-dependent oxidoreductase n=1 Tax=Candidatus Sungiibacteriota bacterium TaxID=2750080 RepID=A0A7T5RJW7_9BACT|nr:MAG: NAD(P)-dependent oxidoreductase [Candidatus Sungbacteria bacterium]